MDITKVILHIGDNLKVLEKSDIKDKKPNIFYIDPPYNTRNNGMSYNDTFTKEEWNNFITPRIKKIFEISSNNAVFYFSIGNEQLAELKLIADDIFGVNNLVALMPRLSNVTSKTTKLISKSNDWLLIYKKGTVEFHGVDYHKEQYKLKDKHLEDRGMYQLRRLDYKEFHYTKSMDFKVTFEGEDFYPGSHEKYETRKNEHFTKDWAWLWSKERIKFAIENDFIVKKGKFLYKKSYIKKHIGKVNGEYTITKINRKKPIDTMHFMDKHFRNASSNKYLKHFSYPKSTNFLNELVRIPKFDEKIVVDIFAGSGSMGSTKNENVKEIHLIQKPEKLNKRFTEETVRTIDELIIKTLEEWNIETEVKTYE